MDFDLGILRGEDEKPDNTHYPTAEEIRAMCGDDGTRPGTGCSGGDFHFPTGNRRE